MAPWRGRANLVALVALTLLVNICASSSTGGGGLHRRRVPVVHHPAEFDDDDVWLEMDEKVEEAAASNTYSTKAMTVEETRGDDSNGETNGDSSGGVFSGVEEALENVVAAENGEFGAKFGSGLRKDDTKPTARFSRRRVSGLEAREMQDAMNQLANSNSATVTYSKKKRPTIVRRNVHHNRPAAATARIPVYMSNVQCPGAQRSLWQCRSSPSSCQHNRDVGVCCKGANGCVGSTLAKGGVRITLGDHNSPRPGGRLEVLRNKQWGTVCDDFFASATKSKVAYNHPVAQTVCLQLGFRINGAYLFRFGGKGRPKAGVSKHEVEQLCAQSVNKFKSTTLDFKKHWDSFTQYTNVQNRAMDEQIAIGTAKSKYVENEVDRKRSQLERRVPYEYNLVRNDDKNQQMTLMSGLRRYTWRFNANIRALTDKVEQDIDAAIETFQQEKGENFKRYIHAVNRLGWHDKWHVGRHTYHDLLGKELMLKEKSTRTFIKRSDAQVKLNVGKFVGKLDQDVGACADSTGVVENGMTMSDMMVSKGEKDVKQLVKDQDELSAVISSAANAVTMIKTIMAKVEYLHGELHKEFTADDTYAATLADGVAHCKHMMNRLEKEWETTRGIFKTDGHRIKRWMHRVVGRLNKVMDVIQQKALIMKKEGDSMSDDADSGPNIVTDADKEKSEGEGADEQDESEEVRKAAGEVEDQAPDANNGNAGGGASAAV